MKFTNNLGKLSELTLEDMKKGNYFFTDNVFGNDVYLLIDRNNEYELLNITTGGYLSRSGYKNELLDVLNQYNAINVTENIEIIVGGNN